MRASGIRRLTLTALFAAVMCVLSLISIPIGAVPLTLQLLGVYLALYVGAGASGILSVLVYIALGALGLPVFSGFGGGVARLFDATGGFIWGFLVLALVYTALSRLLGSRPAARATATAVSLMSLYLCGALWYATAYLGGISELGAALLVTVLPFVLPDILKICVAWLLADRLNVLT